jgi:hypothetical protein
LLSPGSYGYEGRAAQHFIALARRRMAALCLAIRLYRIDHAGEFPDRLDQLVPDYLPLVPVDPLASDGRPLAYRRSPEPIIYSVGADGANDGSQKESTVPLTPARDAGSAPSAQ